MQLLKHVHKVLSFTFNAVNYFCLYASVSSTCAQPPLGYCGHLPTLSVPGVGNLQILHCPGAGHLPTLGNSRAYDTHTVSYQYNYNYTEGFTGKKAHWLICQGQE